MKSWRKANAGYSQLRWVILLLVIAVVLPTVCLLWFMTEAIKNERLAVQQKLVNIYQEKLAEASQKINKNWSSNIQHLEKLATDIKPLEVFDFLAESYDGILIYNSEGKRVFPLLSADMDKPAALAEEFGGAWQLEFAEQKFIEAIKLYEQKALSENCYVRFMAMIGKSRCLAKLGKLDDAIRICRQVAFSPEEKRADSATLTLIANSRLFLTKLLKQDAKKYRSLFEKTFLKIVSITFEENKIAAALPSDQRVFFARRILDIYSKSSYLRNRPRGLDEQGIRKSIAAEELSIQMVKRFPSATALANWQDDQLIRIEHEKEIVYGLRHGLNGGTILLLQYKENAARDLRHYENTFKDSDVVYRILDDSGRFVTGLAQPRGEPFITAFVGEHFPGWETELYFKDGGVFEKAASRQVAVYIWGGMLVIVMILAVGGFAGRVVGRQIRLNKLKNTFLATVSHELKTPLASMRVLVDTLLEGNYKDQRQASEYLQLISKENERLSRLIDNFLTFSRMERNKQVFEMVKTIPAGIANAAAEAVQTKFSNDRCKFDISIDENLPGISADRDAIVTVLVNLLDNAYKYSYDDKKIELKVYAEDNSVCFLIKDNGIGMSRRVVKRIFNRFYQVDRSLSRSANGCGLGLSIVKFIVDAHKGSINVESKPGKGSIFIVKLAAAN